MRTNRAGKIALMIVAAIAFIAVGTTLVHLLWNALLPPLFGWHSISFWQALGLLVLCRILFGRMGGGGFGRSTFRRRMRERWERMDPEERERFRQGMRRGCGPFGEQAPAEPKP